MPIPQELFLFGGVVLPEVAILNFAALSQESEAHFVWSPDLTATNLLQLNINVRTRKFFVLGSHQSSALPSFGWEHVPLCINIPPPILPYLLHHPSIVPNMPRIAFWRASKCKIIQEGGNQFHSLLLTQHQNRLTRNKFSQQALNLFYYPQQKKIT